MKVGRNSVLLCKYIETSTLIALYKRMVRALIFSRNFDFEY